MSATPESMDPVLLEYLIHYCYRRMLDAESIENQRHWFGRMGFYVGQRAPSTVREMEIAQGIAR